MKNDTLTGLMPLVNLKLAKRKLCMKVRLTQLYNNDFQHSLNTTARRCTTGQTGQKTKIY